MTDPDRMLVRRARRGDRRALEELYDRHHRRLLGFLSRILGERPLAEDVFQEVWMKVLTRVGAYREEEGTFRSWLYRIGSNAAIDRLRREARRRGPELDAPVAEGGTGRVVDRIASPAPGPDRIGDGVLFAEAFAGALAALSDRQRVAVLLRHQQELSYAEIAGALRTAEGTAKTLVHRGVKILRDRLAEWSDA